MSDITGGIVAEIIPTGLDGPPLFRIVQHDSEVSGAGPNVRPCDHGRFILDTKWKTVTCGDCHTQVDAFAALMVYAKWYHELERRRQSADHAEYQLHITELRRLAKLQLCTDAERQEIEKAIRSGYGLNTNKSLRVLTRRISEAVRDRRREKRELRQGLRVR